MAGTLRCVTYRQSVLGSSIGELLELLDAVQRNGVRTIGVKADADHLDIYDIVSLYEFLETLATLVAREDADLGTLEEKYEDVRKDVVKIVGRLAQIVAALSSAHASNTGHAGFLF
jgi:hypothetical protein